MFSLRKLDQANSLLRCTEPSIVIDEAELIEAGVACSDLAVVTVSVEERGRGLEAIDKDTVDYSDAKDDKNPETKALDALLPLYEDFTTIDWVQDAACEQLRRKARRKARRNKRAFRPCDANGRKAICFAIDSVTHFKLFTSCSWEECHCGVKQTQASPLLLKHCTETLKTWKYILVSPKSGKTWKNGSFHFPWYQSSARRKTGWSSRRFGGRCDCLASTCASPTFSSLRLCCRLCLPIKTYQEHTRSLDFLET